MPSAATLTQRSGRRGGCLANLLGVVVIVMVIGYGVTLITAPWAFHMGGAWRATPWWSGWARLTSPKSGDYGLFVTLAPARRVGRRGAASIDGDATLCDAHGRRYVLHLSGGAIGHAWLDLNGRPMHLYLVNRPFGATFRTDHAAWRPRLNLFGQFVGPDLVLSDRGAFADAFNADGSLNRSAAGYPRPDLGSVTFRLKSGSKRDFDAACKALRP